MMPAAILVDIMPMLIPIRIASLLKLGRATLNFTFLERPKLLENNKIIYLFFHIFCKLLKLLHYLKNLNKPKLFL